MLHYTVGAGYVTYTIFNVEVEVKLCKQIHVPGHLYLVTSAKEVTQLLNGSS